MEQAPTEKRVCPRCKIEKVLGESFYRSKSSGSRGWAGYCKACTKEKAVEWQKANPEKKKASDHKRWLKPGAKEKLRERLERWQQENPERHMETRRANWLRWRTENPEKVRAAQERYRRSEKFRESQKRFRASERHKERHKIRMRGERKRLSHKIRDMLRTARRIYGERPRLPIGHLVQGWLDLVQAHGEKCVFCGQPGTAFSLEIEHLTPKVKGGSDQAENLAPACRRCNSSKKDKTVEEFEAYAMAISSKRWKFSAAEIRSRSEGVCKSCLTSGTVAG